MKRSGNSSNRAFRAGFTVQACSAQIETRSAQRLLVGQYVTHLIRTVCNWSAHNTIASGSLDTFDRVRIRVRVQENVVLFSQSESRLVAPADYIVAKRVEFTDTCVTMLIEQLRQHANDRPSCIHVDVSPRPVGA